MLSCWCFISYTVFYDKECSMNKIKMFCIGFSAVLCSSLSVSVFADTNNLAASYIQLSSSTSQPANGKNIVHFNASNLKGQLDDTHSVITVHQDGVYMLVIEGQVGVVDQAAPIKDGYVNIWINKNGQPIENFSSRQSMTAGKMQTNTVVGNYLLPLKNGDKVSIGFNASSTTFGLVYFPVLNGAPAAYSAVLTMYKI